MVFFTCNACGQSVKKAQVEKHYMTQCRNCEVLSCMDCGKDFVGDAYKEHTKCVSENEKYGGKNYKPPANKGNKGEAKQEQWLQRVREAKDSAKLRPAVAKLLDRIAEYPNVPRKQKKFENFVYNSLHVPNRGLVEEVWKIFSQASKPNNNNEPKPSNGNSSSNTDTTSQSTDQSQDNKANQSTDSQPEPSENTDQSQNSKKKKKKKKNKGKEDQTDAALENEIVEEDEIHSKKGKRKKRQEDPEVLVSEENGDISRTDHSDKKHKKKKSGKRKRDLEEAEKEVENEDCTTQKMQRLEDSIAENGEELSKPKKFKWDKVIISVLQNSSDHQLPLKKLRKKVLNEFHSCGGDVRIKTDEQLRATFEKKVNKNPNFKVHKEVVTLVS